MARFRNRPGKGGNRWTAEVRWEGQIRTATFNTKTAAKQWAKKVETDISEGVHTPTAESKRRSVRDLLERYKENVIPTKRDQANPRRYADFWIERLGQIRLHKLTRAVVVEVRDELAKTKGPGTVNRYLALLSHACTIAEKEWEWMEKNPLRKVGRLEESPGRARYLSDTEREALLKVTANSAHPHLHAIVLLALTTGARRSEILGLRWKDLDWQARRAILQQTKNKERRSLTLVPQVITELRKIQQVHRMDTDRIFVNLTGNIRESGYHKSGYLYFEKAWREALAEADIKNFRFHDLRPSAASYMAMNGATASEIAAVLGHKTLQMVKRYAHLSDEHIKNVVERTAQKVLGKS